MNELVEIRNQEMIYRARARFDQLHREFWLAKAEELERRIVDQIGFHFRDSGIAQISRALPLRQRFTKFRDAA